ncbi:DUF5714 domain-containing protein [Clostridium senegalense]|uniref:SAM-dependent methyltransferase n=1 Tax=Clostridium senegalense TaxID=1465809 RepID=A0A6M0H5Y6_9CLOT|nr:DUF5714 domain-containing protein [Clostridium senegalense]NEU05728.1 SAM-dependent methyltransferase [Clostridium senegalense]
MENKFNCLICSEELEYFDESKEMDCYFCKKKFSANASCKSGHYVCDSCHSLGAFEIIREYCLKSNSINPMEMALDLMKHPSVKMHGPEHHYLVPAVLVTAYLNSIGDRTNLEKLLNEGEKRAKNVLGGFCGFYGACGAAVGTGIYISLILGASPLSEEKWGLSNLITAKALEKIASFGGPRCCKRDTFLALETAVDFTKEKLNVQLKKKENLKCNYSKINDQCLKDRCKFHKE